MENGEAKFAGILAGLTPHQMAWLLREAQAAGLLPSQPFPSAFPELAPQTLDRP